MVGDAGSEAVKTLLPRGTAIQLPSRAVALLVELRTQQPFTTMLPFMGGTLAIGPVRLSWVMVAVRVVVVPTPAVGACEGE